MAVLCRRSMELRNTPGAVAGVEISIPSTAVEATIRVVDAAGVPIVWTLALVSSVAFHFTAGEAYTMTELKLYEQLTVRIVSAAGSVIELILWTR